MGTWCCWPSRAHHTPDLCRRLRSTETDLSKWDGLGASHDTRAEATLSQRGAIRNGLFVLPFEDVFRAIECNTRVRVLR